MMESDDGKLTLQATGTCFDDALDELARLMRENPARIETAEYKLAHGILKAPDGHLYSHAWIESEQYCIDGRYLTGKVNDLNFEREKGMCTFDRREYYAEMEVIERTLYTPLEAWQENQKSGHYGPWKKKYRKLCKNGGKKRRNELD